MSVRVHRPAISVKLIKMVQRSGDGVAQRFSGAEREIDLTPFLSDNGAVKIVKGIGEAAGGWQFLLNDNLESGINDSFYARIEPMDMIEIRGSRQPHLYAGRPLPIITRGFVSHVRRTESLGGEGEPQRMVAVVGQDSGKLWQIFRLFPESIYGDPNQNRYIETFRLQATQGLEVAFQPVAQTMRDLTERVINRNVNDLAAYAQRVVRPFKTDRITVPEGIVSLNLIAGFQGAYWDLAETIADRPWNELFIEEEEDAPTVVFRPAPYRDLSRRYIMTGAGDPGTIELSAADIVSLDVGRSDQRVANFFYVPPGASMIDSSAFVSVASIVAGEPFDREYGNNRPELYGLRKMQAESRLLPAQIGGLPSQLPEGQRQESASSIVQWHHARARALKQMNRDNSVLEEGSATVKGSELLKPGRYLRITRGSLMLEFYLTRVVHNISPLDSWTSTVTLERGTGFVDRLRIAGSPYWMEGRKGPYDA